MSKSKPKEDSLEPLSTVEKPKGKTKTLYTHGKKFVLPFDKDVGEFLKEKFPKEYK